MATKWTKKKVNSDSLNNGNEWTKDDQVAVEELNSMVNGGLFVQDFVEKLVTNIDTSEIGNVGTPSVELIAGDGATEDKPYLKFKFKNFKGESGAPGGTAPVVQTTGTSESAVMSQKAVTDKLANVEHVDVIYDKTGGAPLDWGYAGGLQSGTYVTGKDFSKYKYLKLYVYISGAAGVYFIDLTTKQIENYVAMNIFNYAYESSSTNYVFKAACYVNANKTAINTYTEIVWLTDGHTYSDAATYYVYKIEGVY